MDDPSLRDRLESLRDRQERVLAAGVPVREFSALSKEYRATLADLEALPVAKEVSAADDIAERRRIRQAGAHRKARPAG